MQTINLSIPGFTIAGKTWGNPKNTPILALHGWLDNANSFDSIASYLQDSFYFIAIDLPGHGHSSHLPEGCYYHFTDALFSIIEILNALQLEKAHILGHSMGACLASLLASIASNRLLSLSLIEGLGPFSAPEDSACKQLTEFVQYLRKTREPKGYKNHEMAAMVRAAKGYVSHEIAKKLTERSLQERDGQFHWRHDRRLITPSPLRLTEGQVVSCLKEITVNTYLIWASKGFSFDSKIMQERIKAVRGIEITHLDGGHHVHMEQPEEISQLLADFYNRV